MVDLLPLPCERRKFGCAKGRAKVGISWPRYDARLQALHAPELPPQQRQVRAPLPLPRKVGQSRGGDNIKLDGAPCHDGLAALTFLFGSNNPEESFKSMFGCPIPRETRLFTSSHEATPVLALLPITANCSFLSLFCAVNMPLKPCFFGVNRSILLPKAK